MLPCLFCELDSQIQADLVKEYNYWKVFVCLNASYLGWCLVGLKRHVEDITEINEQEQLELFKILKVLRAASQKLFKPDRYNYSSLGNEVSHVHIHFIPRYKTERLWNSVSFRDERWSKNYSPYNKGFLLTPDLKRSIIEAYKQKINE